MSRRESLRSSKRLRGEAAEEPEPEEEEEEEEEDELDPRVEKLRRLTEELDESIDDLKATSCHEAINLLCDSLEIQLKETVESCMQHLSKVQDEYLKEISSYRTKLLQSVPDSSISEQAPDNEEIREAIKKFNRDMSYFSRRIFKVNSMKDDVYQNEMCRLKELEDKAEEIGERIKSSLFSIDGTVLKFNENRLFCLSREILGELVYEPPKVQDLTKWVTELNNELNSYRGKSRPSSLELPDGKVAVKMAQYDPEEIHSNPYFLHRMAVYHKSSPQNTNVEIHEDRKLLYSLEHDELISSMVLLPNGWLATASKDKTIKLWTCTSNEPIRTITGHSGAILAMLALKNATLATFARDSTIRIWDPFGLTPDKQLLRTMTCYNMRICPRMSKLSNDYLVTCTPRSEDSDEAIIRVWNPEKGTMVRELPTGHDEARRMLVLSNDEIAIGYEDGIVKIFSLVNSSRLFTIKCHQSQIHFLKELPNGFLQTRARDVKSMYTEYKVLRLDRGELFKSITRFVSTMSTVEFMFYH